MSEPSVAGRLDRLTTLGLGGPARALVAPGTEAELVEVVLGLDAAGEPLLLLGGGSNMVVADEGFAGTVVRLLTRGIESERFEGEVRLTVAAGEPWDAFVAETVASGLAGVETLSGIPGLAGATPIQNVGAYGQEVAQTVRSVRVLDRRTGEVETLAPQACGFGYRTSAFKGDDRYLVLAVTFGLQEAPAAASSPVRYHELARSLGVEPASRVPVAAVRAAVLDLRRSKGMVIEEPPGAVPDPDTRSAGSFFTNPVLSAAAAAALPEGAPRFPQPDGSVKTSAAWLIEHAGFRRGLTVGRAGISTKHTLALTNRGGATTAELLELARLVRAGVLEAFGVELVPEPVLVGCSL